MTEAASERARIVATIAALALAGCQSEQPAVGSDVAASKDQSFVRGLAAKQDFASPAARVALADGKLSDSEAGQIVAEILADIDRQLAEKPDAPA